LYYEEGTSGRGVLSANLKNEELIEAIKTLGKYPEDAQRLLLAPMEQVAPAIGSPEGMLEFPMEDGIPFKFCIAPPFYLPEVQASRLAQYLCTFDPRVKPLMAVVFYWAKVNNIRLGKEGASTFGFAPDPSLLEWMVLYLLCGSELLPTPEEVCSRHPEGKILFEGINIGFKVDPSHAREWRARYNETDEEQKILSVLELALKFFRFWSRLGKRAKKHPRVVDLLQCRHFRKDEIVDLSMDDDDKIKTFSETTGISIQALSVLHVEPIIRQAFYSQTEAITFLHPLHIKYGYSFSSQNFVDSVCPKMRSVAGKLEKMLEGYRSGRQMNLGFTIETVLSVE